ncbi:MAG: NAD-dependent epimerase/dehydratase family protein [Deltaproteobacteria bacterium]|nr:NAD-dependent epimerase/dehydratase family protein [Deltaproteobacteria bacterium]
MENILIIGGSYFAGRVFVEKLLKENRFNVFVFNRGNIRLPFKGITALVGDRERPDVIRASIPPLDWAAVVDFCAYTPAHIRDLLDNVLGSIEQYVFISTTSIYADTLELPVRESAAKLTAPQPELGPYADYGLNKWLAECELIRISGARGGNYTILRPAIIYGRHNYAPRESYFFDLIAQNRTIVLPEKDLPLFSFLWVDDLAEVISNCLGQPRLFADSYNVCGPELISYRRLMQVVGQVSGHEPAIKEMAPLEIERRRLPLPFPLDQHLIYSCEKIREATGINFTPFEDGMRRTWHHYQSRLGRRQERSIL